MTSLFTKIFFWFLLTIFVTFGVALALSNIMFGNRQQQPWDNRMLSYQLYVARQAWEQKGKAGLEEFLTEFHQADGADGVLLDSVGRDVLNGKDYSANLKPQPRPVYVGMPFSQPRGRRNPFLLTKARDGKFFFLVALPNRARPEARWYDVPPQTWWMLGVIALLCYAFARHLTSPLRKMQKSIELFGQGDFSARVNSKRADELGQLARTSDRMAERIENLMKSQRRLLQDISHELRSPLARLGVAVELARGGAELNTSLNRIEKEAERLNTLVGELIQVTRAEGDPSGLVTETVQLDELIQSVVDDVHIESDRRGVKLHCNVEPVEITGSPELLRRAFENVIRNAIRYSPEGGMVDIGLALDHDAHLSKVHFSVRDFGPGVPSESLIAIFDPFYRVESDRGRLSGGVGLGLAIARRAIEIHHGIIRAANANPGLRIDIELPPPEKIAPLRLTSVSATN